MASSKIACKVVLETARGEAYKMARKSYKKIYKI
jgi:hypothetical protein